jgi:hypothetical protein
MEVFLTLSGDQTGLVNLYVQVATAGVMILFV